MAMSDEAIINHLLTETMKVERKEFEGQKRSNENDIILHRQRLVLEHVSSFGIKIWLFIFYLVKTRDLFTFEVPNFHQCFEFCSSDIEYEN